MLRVRLMPLFFLIRNDSERCLESQCNVYSVSSTVFAMRSCHEHFRLYFERSSELFVFTIVQYLHLDFERTLM